MGAKTVQAWRVGDERAETYLRLLAEAELRRAGDLLRGLDAAAGVGNWHVAMAGEPCTLGDGMQAFWLRLTPLLAAVPDAAEVVVTGPATRVRATVAVRPSPGTSRA